MKEDITVTASAVMTRHISGRALDIMSVPDFLPNLLNHITNGGYATAFAKLHSVRYCDLMAWLNSDPSRKARYDLAVSDRDEWLKAEEETNKRLVVESLLGIIQFDIRSVLSEDGTVRPVSEWPAGVSKAISSLDITENFAQSGEQIGWIKKLKAHDKLKAIELLGRHLKMFTDNVNHNVAGTLEALVVGSMGPPKPAAKPAVSDDNLLYGMTHEPKT